ncbi:concanavalin A-like lectin/glucanase domain-containing protein [Zychaea mexicana]|uniref:concanavalin A-like lectin/glucanase domain-containing protein n=1 Tax=Zychaea mexicana TaxID=64656 RepID=UPI0022FDDD86|nr:concanavalin A-like lectin/glucanase domain-containing protein [Zychaea mexicana]KAI9494444.1 concanavalin A-like lectin/glucanase domain-containing protein [Zychaea mexicana]
MDYTVPAKYDNTIDRIFDPANVQVNEDDGGVHLTVRKQDSGNYTSASFGTKRQDILYGTFRANMKTSSEPGTVAAFFFFRNNTCEIDMESLSRIQNPWKTYFSVQPQVYNPDGSASNVTNDKHVLLFDPTSAFHEYRFDWTPEAVTYFLDGQEANQFNQNIPDAPGRVIVNHWTDGNPNYSGAPPTQDATLQLANFTIFFNSSEASDTPPCQRSSKPCSIAGKVTHPLICLFLL